MVFNIKTLEKMTKFDLEIMAPINGDLKFRRDQVYILLSVLWSIDYINIVCDRRQRFETILRIKLRYLKTVRIKIWACDREQSQKYAKEAPTEEAPKAYPAVTLWQGKVRKCAFILHFIKILKVHQFKIFNIYWSIFRSLQSKLL